MREPVVAFLSFASTESVLEFVLPYLMCSLLEDRLWPFHVQLNLDEKTDKHTFIVDREFRIDSPDPGIVM